MYTWFRRYGYCITLYFLVIHLSSVFRRFCLPFLPATSSQLDNTYTLLEYAQSRNCDRSLGSVIDLGSGDGRVLIDLISRPTLKITSAHGVELNRPLVWYSRIKFFYVSKVITTPKVTFTCGNIWKTNLSVYDTVLLFGVDSMMESIEQKMIKELRSGSIVITARYPLPNSEACKSIIDGPHSVFLYKM
ncbi:Protein N-lysine methyltransferase FAM173B [Schistosoma japonicum]|nr:Protein N-lysine methyltransferase FAM173B [Schistosoma japonicum]